MLRSSDYRCVYVCNRYHRLPLPVLPNSVSCDPQSFQLGRTSGSCDRGFSAVLAEQRAQVLAPLRGSSTP